MSETKLRVIAPDVGGGFGSKLDVYAEELLAVALARRLGRPVKWIEERSENALATIHGRDVVTTLEFAATKEGKITGVRADVIASMGAYLQLVTPGIPLLGAWIYAGPYAIPNYDVTFTGVFTNTTPTDAYRGAGRPEATYVLERTMDAARAEARDRPAGAAAPQLHHGVPGHAGLGADDRQRRLPRLARQAARDARLRGARKEQRPARQRRHEAARYRLLDLQRDVRARAVADPGRDPLRGRRLGHGDGPLPADRHHPGDHRNVPARAGPRDVLGADRRRPARLRASTRSRCCTATPRSRRSGWTRTAAAAFRSAVSRCGTQPEGDREGARRSSRTSSRCPETTSSTTGGTFTVKGSPDKAMTIKEAAWAASTAHNLPDGMEPGLEATAVYDPPTSPGRPARMPPWSRWTRRRATRGSSATSRSTTSARSSTR